MRKFIFALVTLFAMPAFAQVQVTGIGSVEAKPDTAYFTIVVTSEKPTAEEATAELAIISSNVIKLLNKRQYGLEEGDVKSQFVSLTPVYKEGKVIHYASRIGYNVRMSQLRQVGTLITDLTKIGVNVINGLHYDVRDRAALETKARVLAMRDALGKAKVLTETVNVEVGTLESVSESPRRNHQQLHAMSETADPGLATVEGEVNVVVMVNCVFEIKNDNSNEPVHVRINQ